MKAIETANTPARTMASAICSTEADPESEMNRFVGGLIVRGA